MKGRRQANFELLRIVAMFMIIALHYLVKGGIAVPFAESDNSVNCVAWLIEAFCIVAVNCYVLISGYFMLESAWKPGRVVSLLCQVLFYALLLPCALIVTGVISGSDMVCHILSAALSICTLSGRRSPSDGKAQAADGIGTSLVFLFIGKDNRSGVPDNRSVWI